MWRDYFLIFPLLAGFLFLAAALVLSFYYLSFPLDTSLIVRFESWRGVRDFGNLFHILFFIILAIFYLALDAFLAWLLYSRKRLYAYLLVYSGLILSLLTLIYAGVIISIN